MEHDAGHSHDAGPEAAHGDAEIPPAPEPRMITPAREDYVRAFPGPGLLWPMVWLVVAIGFYAAAERWKGEVIGEEHAFSPTMSPINFNEAPPAMGKTLEGK